MIKESNTDPIISSLQIDLDDLKSTVNEEKDFKPNEKSTISLYTKFTDPLENAKDQRYLGNIATDSFKYIGVLNEQLQRSKLGKNFYSNGDSYLGYWTANQRDENGLYIYKSVDTKDGKSSTELYSGNWNKGVKEGTGVYIWKEINIVNQELNNDIKSTPFEAFIGNMKDDHYSEGLYITIDGFKQYAYFGSFDKNGIKNDENGLYVQFNTEDKTERIFNGKIKNDKLEEGIIVINKQEDNSSKVIRLRIENGENKLAIVPDDQVGDALKYIEEIFTKLFDDQDFFEKTYKLEGDLISFDKEIDGPEDFSNDEKDDKYAKILKWISEYKELCSKINRYYKIKEESDKLKNISKVQDNNEVKNNKTENQAATNNIKTTNIEITVNNQNKLNENESLTNNQKEEQNLTEDDKQTNALERSENEESSSKNNSKKNKRNK